MQTSSQPSSKLSEVLAQVCIGLHPFQSLEYDPTNMVLSIITESLVPSRAVEQIAEILARRRADEKLSVRRFNDSFKIALVRQMKV